MEHLRITVDGKAYEVTVERLTELPVSAIANQPPVSQPAPVVPPSPPASTVGPALVTRKDHKSAPGDEVSPLAGIVQTISVKVGSTVTAGDPVLILEAMKMYTPVNAPASGTITAIHVNAGDAVEEGQPLYTIS